MLSSRRKQKLSRKSKEENKDAQIAALKRKVVDAKNQLKLGNVKRRSQAAKIESLKRELANADTKLKQSNAEKKWTITGLEQKLLGEEMKLKESNIEKNWVITGLDQDLLDAERKLRKSIQQGEEKDKYIVRLKEQLWDMEEQLKKVDRNTKISSLPDEILVKIFGYLTHNDLGRVAQVSKRWKENAKSPVLWKVVDVTFFCGGSLNEVAANFCENLSTNITHIKICFHRSEWKTPLNFEIFCERLQKKCPHLRVLIVHNAKILDSFWSALSSCAKFLKELKVLVFHQSKFGYCFRIVKNELVSKIEVLAISYCDSIGHIYSGHPLSIMPCLKKLYFAYSSGEVASCVKGEQGSFLAQLKVLNFAKKSMTPYTFELQTLFGRVSSLTELYLCDNHSVYDEDLCNSMFPELKTICLRGCINVTCKAIISLVQSHDSLVNVYSDNVMAESHAENPFVVSNESKLEIVKVIQECNHVSEIDFLHEY